ncbi:unnamed protein product, partial [Cladocopium goreaui]
VYLPESPAWASIQKAHAKLAAAQQQTSCRLFQTFSLSVWFVCAAEFLRGVSFSAIFAIFALFANRVFDLDSVSIGFAVCSGALCLIGTNIWICPHLDTYLGHVGCATLGMMLIAFGEVILAYSPVLKLSLFGMCIVYVGQAVAGCTIATITSVLATDENRGCVMSMQQMAQALGRVFGPMILSTLFSIDPRYPYACAAAAAMIGGLVLMSLGQSFRKRAIDTPFVPIPSPAPWAIEDYSEEDVEDLGRFLCELLTSRHYRFRDPEKRTALKKNLEILFPPLTNDDNFNAESREEGPKNFGSLNGQSDPSASLAVGQFVVRRTPGAAGNRRRFGGVRNQTLPQDILSDLRFWRDVPDAVAAVGMSSGYLLLNKWWLRGQSLGKVLDCNILKCICDAPAEVFEMNWQYLEGSPATAHFVVALSGAFIAFMLTKKILGESLHVFGHSFRLKPATNEVADHGGLVAAYEAKKDPAYGAVEGGFQKDQSFSSFTPGKRKRLNLVAIFVSLLTPWVLFCSIFAALSFQLHYWSPSAAWSSVAAGLALTGIAAFFARRNQIREQDPSWFTFAALAFFAATVLAAILGDMNYWYNMRPYYDIENINSYPDVNPARERGLDGRYNPDWPTSSATAAAYNAVVLEADRFRGDQAHRQQALSAVLDKAQLAQLMVTAEDASGRAHLQRGHGCRPAHLRPLALTWFACSLASMFGVLVASKYGFDAPLMSYDFWAVGVNCCGLSANSFRCGEYSNPKAHAGLRLMSEDQRPFFRLAVQQAEAAYNIKANHPLFFYWMQDPVAEIMHYKTTGFAWALAAIAAHFAFNLLCVGGAAFAFSKLAHEF